MNRRDFLLSGMLLGLLPTDKLFAQTFSEKVKLNDKKLIVILLRGGADGLSMLIPHKSELYYKYRPNIAVPKRKIVELNDLYGIHPGLKDSLLNFYENNELQLFPNAGQIDNSRSHFHAQYIMENGINSFNATNGFLNRLSQITEDAKPFCFTNITEIFRGQKIIGNFRLSSYFQPIENATELKNKYSISKELSETFDHVLYSEDLLRNVMFKDKYYNQKTLFGKMGTIIREAKINISFIDLHDWDTHAMQGTIDGKFNDLIENLNSELINLKTNLGTEWKNTRVIMMSEFGRMIEENGSMGTEHGHGNLISVFGGDINKSEIIGKYDDLDISKVHENRDLIVQNDYREIIGDILKGWGYSDDSINFVFPKEI